MKTTSIQSRLIITQYTESTIWNHLINKARYRGYSGRGATPTKNPTKATEAIVLVHDL